MAHTWVLCVDKSGRPVIDSWYSYTGALASDGGGVREGVDVACAYVSSVPVFKGVVVPSAGTSAANDTSGVLILVPGSSISSVLGSVALPDGGATGAVSSAGVEFGVGWGCGVVASCPCGVGTTLPAAGGCGVLVLTDGTGVALPGVNCSGVTGVAGAIAACVSSNTTPTRIDTRFLSV